MTSVSLAAVIGGAEISGVTRAAIALVLVVAALLKLVRPGGAVSGLVGLGLPRGAARSLVAAMTVGELAVATLLITGSGYLGAALAGALLVGFSSYLVVLTRRAPSAQCGCFGDYSSKSPYAGLLRNLLLAGLLVPAAVASSTHVGLAETPAAIELAVLVILVPEALASLLDLRR